MTKRFRLFITLAFISVFFATAPVVLLRTSGYGIDWQHQRVRKTGSIHVETIPSEAQVSLEGVAVRKNTPAIFSRLLPETYRLRIERPDYLPWEKRLEVTSGNTTFAVGVVLYRDAIPRLALDREVLTAAWSPDGSDVVLLAQDSGWQELLAVIDDGTPILLGRFSRDAYADGSIAWSPDGRSVLFTATKNGSMEVQVFFPGQQTPAVAVTDSIQKKILAARWLDDSTIGLASVGAAYQVNAATGKISTTMLGAGITDVVRYQRDLYVLQSGTKPKTPVTVSRVSDKSLVPFSVLPAGTYRFQADAGQSLTVREKSSNRLTSITVADGQLTDLDATGVVPEPDGKRLLVWNDYEISIMDADGKRELLTRLSTPLIGCAWSPDGDSVLYATADSIVAIEIDGRDQHNVHELVRFSSVKHFAVDRTSRLLRFVGAVGNQRGVYEREL